MGNSKNITAQDRELIDRYLNDDLDEKSFSMLEHRLCQDAQLKEFFVEYASVETALSLHSWSSQVLAKTTKSIREETLQQPDAELEKELTENALVHSRQCADPVRRYSWRAIALAASVALVLGSLPWIFGLNKSEAIAWVTDAQDCSWNKDSVQQGRLVPRQILTVKSGLLELGFASEATVLVEGPAEIEIKSASQLRLLKGRVAVKMPKGLSGFEVLTQQGRILDLGTEFGVSVDSEGKVDVKVFEGKVVASLNEQSQRVELEQDQTASLFRDAIQVDSQDRQQTQYKLNINPQFPRTPSRMKLDFNDKRMGSLAQSTENMIFDKQGLPTGFPLRLSNTGSNLLRHDENLKLDQERGVLEVKATRSDINLQAGLDHGEYLGTKLSELGYSGNEDFEVSMRVLNAPEMTGVGQYGIYIALGSETCIRGGVIDWGNEEGAYKLFLVNTTDGKDHKGNQVGYVAPGSDVELKFRRVDGAYSLEVRNLENGYSNTLGVKNPDFLNSVSDLQVGIFVATPFDDKHATVTIDNFEVTVWSTGQADNLR